jgi:hypothetical protein
VLSNLDSSSNRGNLAGSTLLLSNESLDNRSVEPECRSKYKSQPIEAQYSEANPTILQTKRSYSSSSSSSSVHHSGSSSSNVSDIAGGIVGMAGAAGAAIAGAPVAAVVGIGIALWFFVRSVMS